MARRTEPNVERHRDGCAPFACPLNRVVLAARDLSDHLVASLDRDQQVLMAPGKPW